jgi:branched-chain amino acid aminotransferase
MHRAQAIQSTIVVMPTTTPVASAKRAALIAEAGFGNVFTDHMVTVRWHTDCGWHDAEVRAREPLQLDPACAALHYAQEIFEGLKAYRTKGGGVALFRPDENARRFAASASRLAMPVVPETLFVDAVRALVDIDRDWIPNGEGSLYLRPFMFASEAFLGVRAASEYLFCIIACPAGAYFKGGAKPLRLWISEEYSRAGRGGTGAAKCGGNYAASLLAQADATRHDCDQVVFLDAAERCWVEELGGMNLFFVMDDGEIITPPLGGTILPGLTRSSLITLARDRGFVVNERPYAIRAWREDAASGRLTEAFACGTAAVVAGIGEVRSSVGDFTIADGKIGDVTNELRRWLIGVQSGDLPDPHSWRCSV